MTTRQAPPPRPTLVGLEAAREEPITPPRGSEEVRRSADVSLLLQELRRLEGACLTDQRELSSVVRSLMATMRTRDEALFALLGVPQQLRDHSLLLRDLQGAVKRLDERLNRTERRGESQSEIVERVAALHVEDETTEVRARSLEMVRRHKLRMAVIKWVAVVLLPLLGAALHRLLGG